MSHPRDLARLAWRHRRFWLAPVVAALLLVGVLAALSATRPVGPFIYPQR